MCQQRAWFGVTAGLGLWTYIRSLGAAHGLEVQESKGWFERSFVLRGPSDNVLAAFRDAQRFIDMPDIDA